jgi:hypothetical protein
MAADGEVERPVEPVAIQEAQGAESLILGRRSHSLMCGQVRQKRLDCCTSHFVGMSFVADVIYVAHTPDEKAGILAAGHACADVLAPPRLIGARRPDCTIPHSHRQPDSCLRTLPLMTNPNAREGLGQSFGPLPTISPCPTCACVMGFFSPAAETRPRPPSPHAWTDTRLSSGLPDPE